MVHSTHMYHRNPDTIYHIFTDTASFSAVLQERERKKATCGNCMDIESTQTQNGCREGRRPFAGQGQSPCGFGQSPTLQDKISREKVHLGYKLHSTSSRLKSRGVAKVQFHRSNYLRDCLAYRAECEIKTSINWYKIKFQSSCLSFPSRIEGFFRQNPCNFREIPL